MCAIASFIYWTFGRFQVSAITDGAGVASSARLRLTRRHVTDGRLFSPFPQGSCRFMHLLAYERCRCWKQRRCPRADEGMKET